MIFFNKSNLISVGNISETCIELINNKLNGNSDSSLAHSKFFNVKTINVEWDSSK